MSVCGCLCLVHATRMFRRLAVEPRTSGQFQSSLVQRVWRSPSTSALSLRPMGRKVRRRTHGYGTRLACLSQGCRPPCWLRRRRRQEGRGQRVKDCRVESGPPIVLWTCAVLYTAGLCSTPSSGRSSVLLLGYWSVSVSVTAVTGRRRRRRRRL